jgi:hypothetical protein
MTAASTAAWISRSATVKCAALLVSFFFLDRFSIWADRVAPTPLFRIVTNRVFVCLCVLWYYVLYCAFLIVSFLVLVVRVVTQM